MLSVIIPTFNRAPILKECLQALANQTINKKDFEIIVVDDGSTDNTKKIAESFDVKYVYQKNQGQGNARNHGLKYAKGEIVILIGDDIIVTPDFLQEHLRYHLRYEKENEAVLGFVTWHPKLPVTPFMRWLTNSSSILGRFGGHQFAYEKLQGKQEADFNFFYTANISLKFSLLDKYPFDPSFSGYGFEDIELGYRLTKKENLKLYYNPNAIGYHDHFMNEESLAGRMYSIGESAVIFHHKYPELKKVPGPLKHLILLIISNSFFIKLFKKINKDFYYYALSKKYFLNGLSQGKKNFNF